MCVCVVSICVVSARSYSFSIFLDWQGSVSFLDDEKSNVIARVFRELPQRVIWKHSEAPPSNLGNNTMLSDWIPQNDLLGEIFLAKQATK